MFHTMPGSNDTQNTSDEKHHDRIDTTVNDKTFKGAMSGVGANTHPKMFKPSPADPKKFLTINY